MKTRSHSGGFDKNKIVLFDQNKITLRRPQSHLTRKSAKRGVSSSFTGLEKVNLAHKTKQGTINCAILGSMIRRSGDPRRKWEEMGEREREREREKSVAFVCIMI